MHSANIGAACKQALLAKPLCLHLSTQWALKRPKLKKDDICKTAVDTANQFGVKVIHTTCTYMLEQNKHSMQCAQRSAAGSDQLMYNKPLQLASSTQRHNAAGPRRGRKETQPQEHKVDKKRIS